MISYTAAMGFRLMVKPPMEMWAPVGDELLNRVREGHQFVRLGMHYSRLDVGRAGTIILKITSKAIETYIGLLAVRG
jgi:hypothetical protein